MRRNSTSAPAEVNPQRLATPVSPRSRRNSTSSVPDTNLDVEPGPKFFTAPEDPQTVNNPAYELSPDFIALRDARNSQDPAIVAEAVIKFRATSLTPSLREYNMALTALFECRQPGDSLNLLLETYTDLLNRSLLPNYTTYSILIQAFLARDQDVQQLIRFIEARAQRMQLTGSLEGRSKSSDETRVQELKAESNFASAMSLFEAILAVPGQASLVQPSLYAKLLRAAATHGSAASAVHVFGQVEQRVDLALYPLLYRYLLKAYSGAAELAGAEDIFTEYKRKLADGSLAWPDAVRDRRIHMQIYNQMIEAYFKCGHPEKAVALLESMVASTAPVEFGPQDIPPPGSSTFSTVLQGFVGGGDFQSALVWFDRLMEQATFIADSFTPLGSGQAMRPDASAYATMLDTLALKHTPETLGALNKIYLSLKNEPELALRAIDRPLVFAANMAGIHGVQDDEKAFNTLDFIKTHVLDTEVPNFGSPHSAGLPRRNVRLEMMSQVISEYFRRGNVEAALDCLAEFVNDFARASHDLVSHADNDASNNTSAQQLVLNSQRQYFRNCGPVADLSICVRLAKISDSIQFNLAREYTPAYLHAYGIGRVEQTGIDILRKLSPRDWEILLSSTLQLTEAPRVQLPEPFAFPGVFALLEDMSKYEVNISQFQPGLIEAMIKRLIALRGQEQTAADLTNLGSSFLEVGEGSPIFKKIISDLTPPEISLANDSPVHITEAPKLPTLAVNTQQTKSIDELVNHFVRRNPAAQSPIDLALEAFERYKTGLSHGRAPSPAAISRLIQALGRINEMDKVRAVYTSAQEVLFSLESNKKWQAESWFLIEDGMIIAHAHSGDVDAAHVHRARILEQGGSPTADAYGALILYVKDTTDDASNALALFQECQARGVLPNQYLFNNIISKLSKARKADQALELFKRMRDVHRIIPSSITYGAVIGACARVGDVQSAETLFEEMVQAKNFKPRVPPFNTMMQLYTTTKPNRDRALHFYNHLKLAGVQPTAHTYKVCVFSLFLVLAYSFGKFLQLLMDAYGAIEPVDISSMEHVFEELQSTTNIEIQGTHFASLINAYGCVHKDLDKALNVFNSIATNPRASPVDAVVFEAVFNVLVTHRRTDLLDEYVEKMNIAKVHMTAYVTNVLIKGYAIAGDLTRARQIFESLIDPPEGVAAPNNHAPHDPSSVPQVDPTAPVFREVSAPFCSSHYFLTFFSLF